MIRRRTVARRVLVSYVLVTLAYGLTLGFGLVSQRRSTERADLLRTGYMPLMLSVGTALQTQNLVSAQLNHITDAKNPTDAQSWIETERRVRPLTFAEIRAAVANGLMPSTAPEARTFGADLVRDANDIERFLAGDADKLPQLFDALRAGDALRANHLEDELVSFEVEGAGRIRELSRRIDRQLNELVTAARVEERQALASLLALAALTLLVGIGVSLYVRKVLRPLTAVTDRARAVAAGDLTPRNVAISPDEIGELAATFEGMVAAIARANAGLVQAERLAAIGKMAAHVTHEIRNPLSSMGLNIELLEEELSSGGDAKEAKQLVRAIRREVDRLSALSEEYLRVARRPAPKLERDDLGALVRDVVEFVRPEMEQSNVRSTLRIDGALPEVLFDEGQIRQALLNLLRNAREAMQPSGGDLLLSVEHRDHDVTIVIEDSGSGIGAEAREQIFDPFFTTKERGTGLGLAITRQIVEAHGGRIACTPRTPRGTRFSIVLPRAADEKAALVREAGASAANVGALPRS